MPFVIFRDIAHVALSQGLLAPWMSVDKLGRINHQIIQEKVYVVWVHFNHSL